jgi:hypothetical protein
MHGPGAAVKGNKGQIRMHVQGAAVLYDNVRALAPGLLASFR